MRHLLVLLIGLCWTGSLHAEVPFKGPVEGFTFDPPTGSFRAVIGSLGASSLGPALSAGFDYGSVAPRHNFGIAFKDGRCLIVSDLDSDHVKLVNLTLGPIPLPEGVVWSSDGSSAILYSRTGNWMQTLKGIPDSVIADPLLDLSIVGGILSAVATNSRGDFVAIGLVGEAAGVYELVQGHSFVPLLSISQPSSLSFSSDGRILYVLDRDTNQLVAFRTRELASVAWQLSDMGDPIAVAAISDTEGEQLVYVAGRNDQLLVAYDPNSQIAQSSTKLSARPTAIQTLGQHSFLLGSRTAVPGSTLVLYR